MTKEELLKNTSLFLLDLDGTVYLGEKPIGGMAATLARLRTMGKRLVFLTNNSSKSESEYREKLARIGLLEQQDEVYTSGMVAAEYLKEHFAGARVYLVGTKALREEFERADILLCEGSPDVCLLAYDTELTFEKIEKLDGFLRRGVPFLATHPDDVCPSMSGSSPDVGSFLAMFERSSGRRPDLILGKPYTPMGEAIVKRFHTPPAQVCMVGDRMYTDIRFAKRNAFTAVLVLSGETTIETMARYPDIPDLVLDSLNDLI